MDFIGGFVLPMAADRAASKSAINWGPFSSLNHIAASFSETAMRILTQAFK